MTAYPDDAYVTCAACMYFDNMSRFAEMKERLLKQGVLVLMATAFQKFSNLGDGAFELQEEERPLVTICIKGSKGALGRLIDI
jgi:hypothetical protein